MLASDSNESEYDSDSSSDSGPRQVWGNRNLKSATTKYNFETELPEDGEQFLLAVRNERSRIPTCVAADKSKIDNIKKRKSAEQKSDSQSCIDGEASETSSIVKAAEETKPSTELTDQMQRLKLQETSEENSSAVAVKTDAECEEAKEDLARFLPTPRWRANRTSQFNYIRIKMDLSRDMMLQGKFYVVPSFTKFERDRIYWLRYCFGTLDSAKMIEIKRSRKLRAKELYEATKKLKVASQSPVEVSIDKNQSESDSDDSDVHIVSKEDVAELNVDAPSSPSSESRISEESSVDKDDLMKISGGSMDELVVIHTPETKAKELLKHGSVLVQSDNSIIKTDDIKLTSEAELKDTKSTELPDVTQVAHLSEEVKTVSSEDSEIQEVRQCVQDLLPAEVSTQLEVAEKSVEKPSLITEKVKVEGTGDDIISEDDFIDPTAELRKLHGHQPTANLLISMPQRLLEYLTTLQLEWLKEFGLISRKQGNWLFALFSSLQVPFEPDLISDLRQIALQCVKIRDKAKEYIKWSEAASSTEKTIFSPVFEIINEDEFEPEDVISSCNLFIGIVVDYFVQKDLNKYLTLDGKNEF